MSALLMPMQQQQEKSFNLHYIINSLEIESACEIMSDKTVSFYASSTFIKPLINVPDRQVCFPGKGPQACNSVSWHVVLGCGALGQRAYWLCLSKAEEPTGSASSEDEAVKLLFDRSGSGAR